MTLLKPIENNFHYKQPVPSKEETENHIKTHKDIKALLQNTFVFVHDTRATKLWLISPIEISKKQKKIAFFINNGYQIGVQSQETIDIKPQPVTYDAFKTNLQVIMNRLNNQTIPWTSDKNKGITDANQMTHLIDRVSLEVPKFQQNKIQIESLYDVLSQITPSIDTHIEKLNTDTSTETN